MKPKRLNDIHVEILLYLTMGKIDQDLTDSEINFIIETVVSKNKNFASRSIIETIFDESFKWWLEELENETLWDTIAEQMILLKELDTDEKQSIIETLNKLVVLDKPNPTSDELDLLSDFTDGIGE
jgi:hypothetical protein